MKKKPNRKPTEAEIEAGQALVSAAKFSQLDLIIARCGPLGLADYVVRESLNAPERYGIYLRKFNVCVAVFAPNSYRLRELLKNLFDDAFDAAGLHAIALSASAPPPKRKRKKK